MKNKWWKIVLKFLYYGFTFTLGILIAFVLPGINYEILTYESFNEYVENDKYSYALDLLGGIYNEEKICEFQNNDGSVLSIFETLSVYDEYKENKIVKSTFNESYSCFLTNVQPDKFVAENNQAKVLINGDKIINILHDSNDDGKDDAVSTLTSSNFIYFTIDKTYIEKVERIEVFDASGNIYLCVDKNLVFESVFFETSTNFIEIYNKYSADGFTATESEVLEKEYNIINKVNGNYKLSGSYVIKELKKEANKEATIFVLIYFIWIYILGDLLVGKRYIIKFGKFVYTKIKSKIKPKKEIEPVGNFYSTVNFKANILEEIDTDIILSYENTENQDFNFKVILTKTKQYTTKARVHSGSYNLKTVECLNYEVENLKTTLEVKGFFTDVLFDVKKK